MKTHTMIWVNALLWGVPAYYGAGKTAVVVVLCTALVIIFLHRIEVKINKLLDDRRIIVSEQELRE